jgi:hypothetical protein
MEETCCPETSVDFIKQNSCKEACSSLPISLFMVVVHCSFFYPEDGADLWQRNVGWLSKDRTCKTPCSSLLICLYMIAILAVAPCLFLCPEAGGDLLLRNIGLLSKDRTTYQLVHDCSSACSARLLLRCEYCALSVQCTYIAVLHSNHRSEGRVGSVRWSVWTR